MGSLVSALTLAAPIAQVAQVNEAASTAAIAAPINLFQAIVIGIVQGLTEFLPISSTAHVKMVPVVLGWGDPGVAFTAVIQLGSIAAMIWYFWADLRQVVGGMAQAAIGGKYNSPDFRLGLGILLGTLPIVVGGLLIKAFIPDFDNSPLRSSATIAIVSIVMALLLGVAEMFSTRQRTFEALTLKDGVIMGFAQALALIPGVSRSGSTLTAGLFMGLERATAARFSFLLGIPAITLAGLVELEGLLEGGVSTVGLAPLIGGLIAALVSSYLAIFWLLRFLKQHSTWVFVWYRLAFGAAILLALATGKMQNI
ncbi:undecaprenyl-diphosphate phosphatase [Leptolyngbya sp. CCNP1308]|uniref:undecaprenyl-diphosphate phosphatase n=1 Tax=Leptolyngbya sp. CCNP1308 TaxID=3110255 RepID=UPI002B204684|nr:undecaprenyl-diphosphate phosphatase [Leptolyngbya sp. CCNP1308]MEA5448916.1 undecaprenyl-diphosphate phosphatase [Leptolyngbya sp. CCNP1308]